MRCTGGTRRELTFLSCVALGLVVSANSLVAQPFLRGDFNCDGAVGLNDGYYILKHLVGGYVPPCTCPASGDTDNNGVIQLSDGVSLLNHLVFGGPGPAAPYPTCGVAPSVLACPGYPGCNLFKRGDANQDGCVNIDDATFIAAYLSTGGPPPASLVAADADDDDTVSLSDVTYIANYCGTAGSPPPLPGPLVCGPDPTPGALPFGTYSSSACAGGCATQIAADCNQDGSVDVSDGVCLLGFLFFSSPSSLPCGDGTAEHPSNGMLLSVNGPLVTASGPAIPSSFADLTIDISDVVYLFDYLFLGGPPPVQGTGCIFVPECPQNPACPTCGP